MRSSLIIPTYNLYGARVRNLLNTIKCQTVKSEVIIVDYGSTDRHHNVLRRQVSPYDVNLIRVPDVEWSPPRACNVGIRRAKGEIVIKLDADLIMEPHTVEDTLSHLEKNRKSFVIRQPKFLTKKFNIENLEFPRDYEKVREAESHYILPSYGGFFAAPRGWWHEVHGYDERYLWYGCNDWDQWNRARRSGLRIKLYGEPGLKGMQDISPYPPDTVVYHQWHKEPWVRLNISKEKYEHHKERNREIYHNAGTVVRNGDNWGMVNHI